MSRKGEEDLEALNKQIEEEKDAGKKGWLEYIRDFSLGRKSKNARVFEDVKKIDINLKRALTIVLNYYAESEGQFNQTHLDDLKTLINMRAERVKKLK